MTIYINTNSKNSMKVIFTEVESNNIKMIFGDDKVSVRNIRLCYYLENELPKRFAECKGKRVMVLNVQNGIYITVFFLLQDIKAKFIEPKKENTLFKVTQLTFEDGKTFYDWKIANPRYNYKLTDSSSRGVKIIVYNMSEYDELAVSNFGAQIDNVCNIVKYYLLEATGKIEKCFS